MITVNNEYNTAAKAYMREFDNIVKFTYGETTKTYKGCKITISERMVDNDKGLAMGKAFSRKCEIYVYEPELPFDYSLSKITVINRLNVSDGLTDVPMGIFYASEVKSEDDYFSMSVTGYDKMAKMLEEPYVPTVTLPTTDTAIINDICTQYNVTTSETGIGKTIDTIYEATAGVTLGYMAGLQGKNAMIDRTGNLVFRWYASYNIDTWDSDTGAWTNDTTDWTHAVFKDATYEMARSEQKQGGFEKGSQSNVVIHAITSGSESTSTSTMQMSGGE